MRRYRGNQRVAAGVYLNPRRLAFASLDDDTRLPGGPRDAYVRVPTLALLVAGPVIGLVYVIFLPLIGFVMLAWAAGGKLVEVTARGTAAFVAVLQPAWRPAIAFLSRGRPVRRRRKGDAWSADVKRRLERHDAGAG